MSIRALGFALILIALAAAPALAEEGPDYGRTGAYAGAGLALGFDNFHGALAVPGDWSTGLGFNAWGGYRFAPNFAGELMIEYIDRVNNPTASEANLLNFSGNLKGYLSTGQLQPFALVGIGVTRISAVLSNSAFAARFGGGVDFYTSENFSLGCTAAYVMQTGDLNDLDYISVVLGAQYRF